MREHDATFMCRSFRTARTCEIVRDAAFVMQHVRWGQRQAVRTVGVHLSPVERAQTPIREGLLRRKTA